MNIAPHAGRQARFIIVFAILALAGCATGNIHELKLEPPPAPPAGTVRAQSVMLRNVTDQRTFQEQSTRPDTPSVTASEDIAPTTLQARAIGRVSEGFGKERGDVL